jgi:hypothetical protein
MGRLALAAVILGVALMLGFDETLTRIAGVTLLFAWIVLGIFALARPEDLARDPDL